MAMLRQNVLVELLEHYRNRIIKESILEVYRTPANRRYYTEEQYLRYIAQSSDEGKKDQRKNVAYARAPTYGQKDDLTNQIAFIRFGYECFKRFCQIMGRKLLYLTILTLVPTKKWLTI